MGNIIYNLVQVRGPQEDLKALSDAMRSEDPDYGLWYFPKNGEKLAVGWEEKWKEYEPGNDPFQFYFASKWGPPLDVIETASKDFPKLIFDVFYAGQGPVYGMAQFENGSELVNFTPETLNELKELVDLVRYKYDTWTPEQFARRKQDLLKEITEGFTPAPPIQRVPPANDAPVVGIWLTLIGAMTAYSYFKNR